MKRILMTALLSGAMLMSAVPVHGLDHLVWKTEGGKQYWYENGTRQGMPGDPKNITDTVYGYERGREIYDPASDGWYWLDAIYNGAKAENKEVWMPYIYQSDMAAGINKEGKWVRYNGDGKMIKGWYTPVGSDAKLYPGQVGNLYYYDLITGQMVKGDYTIDNTIYHFDEVTGVLDNLLETEAYNDDLYDFINRFQLGYSSYSVDYSMVYSAANPAVNSVNIFDHLIATSFKQCVDYDLYPSNSKPAMELHPNETDPYNWFEDGYFKYDGYNIDWIRENVLNLAEPVFEELLKEAENNKDAYRLASSSTPHDYSYYTFLIPTGWETPEPMPLFHKVTGTGRIRIVEYGIYGSYYDGDKWVLKSEPSVICRCFLQRKMDNSTLYWSILANEPIH